MSKKEKIILVGVLIGIVVFVIVFFNISKDSERIEVNSSAEKITANDNLSTPDLVEIAMKEVKCPELRNINYPERYYQGPLIDTHIHVATIPNNPEDFYDEGIMPLLGVNSYIGDTLCMLDHGEINKAFVFFPVWEPAVNEAISVVEKTVEKYPGRIVPFINPPTPGYPTIKASTLRERLELNQNLFNGLGELGLYEEKDQQGNIVGQGFPPNSSLLQEIYPILREYKMSIYIHLGEKHQESFEQVAGENRDINFIFHGDQLIIHEQDNYKNLTVIEGVLNRNPNVYYGIDPLYGHVWMIRPEVTKEEFLAHLSNKEELLKIDLALWKDFISRHPNQVLWGTDRGANELWSLDPEISQALTEYTREFIGLLDPEVQERFAYKNAEKLIAN